MKVGTMASVDVKAISLSGDRLAAELERLESASVLVCHPDLEMTAIMAVADAGAGRTTDPDGKEIGLVVRPSAERCAPGEWELF